MVTITADNSEIAGAVGSAVIHCLGKPERDFGRYITDVCMGIDARNMCDDLDGVRVVLVIRFSAKCEVCTAVEILLQVPNFALSAVESDTAYILVFYFSKNFLIHNDSPL